MRGLWKPLATIAVVAGLLAATLLTATAAGEGGLFQGSAAVQAPPAQTSDNQTTTSSPPPPVWAWPGEVRQAEAADGHLEIKGPCGTWALLPADDAMKAALEALLGKKAYVVGRLSPGPNAAKRYAVQVQQVFSAEGQIPESVRLFPGCRRQPKPYTPKPVPMPSMLGLLEQLGLQRLHEVPQDQRFEHFIGVQASFLDAAGSLVTARVTAGVATTVGSGSLSIDPNGPETGLTVPVDAETRVLRPGEGGLAAIVVGDKVLVVQVGDKTVAVIASKQVTSTVWPGAIRPLLGASAQTAAGSRPMTASHGRGRGHGSGDMDREDALED